MASKSEMKLPKLTMKKFNGDPLKYKSFIDSFNCAIHQNNDLSEIEKMTYLLNLVEGDAEQAIKGLQLSNENYKSALNLLQERFGDDQIIVSAHMNKLLNLESSSEFIDVKEVRNLYDTIEIQVRSLCSIGLEEKSYGPMLVPIIMSKLPQEIKLILTRQFGKNQWEVTKILQALKNEIQAREKVLLTTSAEEDSTNLLSNYSNKFSSSHKQFQPCCVFCNRKNYKSYQCFISKRFFVSSASMLFVSKNRT